MNFNISFIKSGTAHSFILGLTVVLYHFSPVKPFEYPLTIVPFVCIYMVLAFIDFKMLSQRGVVVYLVVIVFVVIKSIYYIGYDQVSITDFLKTFLLWFFYITSIFLLLSTKTFKNICQLNSFLNGILISIYVIFLFVFFQFFYYRITGDLSIYAVWGDYSYGGQGYTLRSIEFGSNKANGFFLESSSLGLVSLCLLTCLYLLKDKFLFFPSLMIASIILVSGSAIGLLSFFCIVSTIFIKGKVSGNLSINMKFLLKFLSYFLLVLFLLLILPYISSRFGEFFVEGTSIYYRLVAPFEIIQDILVNNPFGIAFGMMENILLSYNVDNGGSYGKTLDNGWYLLILYFGWLGIFGCLFIVIGFFYSMVTQNERVNIAYLFIICSPFFTGAVFSPEFLFLQMLLFFSFSQRRELVS